MLSVIMLKLCCLVYHHLFHNLLFIKCLLYLCFRIHVQHAPEPVSVAVWSPAVWIPNVPTSLPSGTDAPWGGLLSTRGLHLQWPLWTSEQSVWTTRSASFTVLKHLVCAVFHAHSDEAYVKYIRNPLMFVTHL